MLHNLAAGKELYGTKDDPQIYAHTAAEFQIYKDHPIKPPDVYVLLYVNIKDKSDKITTAMINCNGLICD